MANPHSEVFYESPEFFVAAAFVLAIAMIAKPVFKILRSMLRSRVEGVIKRIQDAMKLKDDAQKLLVEYERKFISAENEAKKILEKAEKQVELVKNETISKLEKDILNKENEISSRLKALEDEALKDIKTKTTDIVMNKVKNVIKVDLDNKAHSRLIDASIEKL